MTTLFCRFRISELVYTKNYSLKLQSPIKEDVLKNASKPINV